MHTARAQNQRRKSQLEFDVDTFMGDSNFF